ncbi:MAG: PEP-CTERM sorting domain-containing protein [Acidobacteriota bacterium]|nr:PEP-CTERM sorting domain-containing protein [Acidobacteriota bacterium]
MRRSFTFLAALALSTCAFADTMAWVATGDAHFGTVDLNTGAYSQTSAFGFQAAGLGEIGNSLYTGAEGSTTLYSVNPTTGATAAVGNGSISLYAFGSTRTALYMIDTVGGLWNINASTGASTFIGSTLLPIGANTTGMSTGSDTLYFALGTNVYTIDTTNGHATYAGTTSPNFFGALVDVQDRIYGTNIVGPDQSYTFDPLSGTSSYLANASIPGYAWGLAPVVPEPGSFALLGVGAMLLGGYALRRKLA